MDASSLQTVAVQAILHEQGLDGTIPAGGRWGVAYHSLEKKRTSLNFDFPDFTTPAQLVEALRDLRRKGYCFRGHYDASWHLYTSCQRKYYARERKMLDEQLHERIVRLIGFVRKNDLTEKVFGCSQAELLDAEIIGHLQHFGVATPFLDFSSCPLVALFFAMHQDKAGPSDNHSIYAITSNFISGRNEIVDFEGWLEKHDKGNLPRQELVPRSLYGLEAWHASAMLFHKGGAYWNPIVERGRIHDQSGLFLYMEDKDRPVEEYFSEYYKSTLPGGGDVNARNMERILCFDFPASWDDELRTMLNAKGINEYSLGLSDHTLEEKWRNALQRDFPDLI